jgi:hypothetical protein
MNTNVTANREFLRYGFRIALHCPEKNGFVVGTTSGISPVGVAEDSEQEPLRHFEQAVFTIVPGDRDVEASRHEGEPVKFGNVVRLIHHKQKKAVAYNTKLHSVVDPAHHRVTLEDGIDGSDRWDKWRIMPRYKVRGEGERITDGDHIVLQVSSGDKLFLGTSKRRDEAADNCYEVHAGSLATGFAVRIYDSEVEQGLSRTGRALLRAGDCVTLYHKERHSYVFLNSDNTYILNPVVDVGTEIAAKNVAMSTGSMFLIEGRDHYRGGIVYNGRENCYRLKDLRTGKYMTCAADESVATRGSGLEDGKPPYFTLTDLRDDSSTLFAFHNVGEDQMGGKLADRSKVFLECPFYNDEGVWLHEGEPIVSRRVGMRDGYRLEKLHTERTRTQDQRHMLRGIGSLAHSDGIEFQRVDDAVFQKLNIILSFLPPITQLADSVCETVPEYSRVIQVQENLVQLKQMVAQRAGTPQRQLDEASQRQLHDQGVSVLCLTLAQQILDSPNFDLALLRTAEPVEPANTDPNNSNGGGDQNSQLKYTDIFEVLQQAFGLVQAIVQGIPSHATAIEEWMEFIVESVPLVPAALECFLRCVENNLDIVDTNETKITNFFCEQLKKRRRFSGAMSALSLMMWCGDRGIRQHQEVAAQVLLSDRKMAEKLFIRVSTSGGSVQIAVPNFYLEENVKRTDSLALTEDDPQSGGMTWINLGKLDELSRSKHLTRLPLFMEFFIAQMNFFSALCAGKNARGVAATINAISLEAVVPVMLSDNVPASIRAAFIRYFTQAVLFCEGSLDIREVCRALHYVVREPQALDLETDYSPMFEEVKEFAIENLSQLAACAYQTRPELLVMADAVVSLCHGLLCRGMFRMTEYPGLISLIVAIVDSRDDAIKLGVTQKSLTKSQNLTSSVEMLESLASVQMAVLAIVDTIATFLISKHALETVDRFCHGQRLPRLSQLFDIDPQSDLLDMAERHHTKERSHFTMLDRDESDFNVLASVLAACMDAGQHRSIGLRSLAFRLFCRLTNFPRELLRAIKEVQLLTNSGAALYYKEAKLYADELTKLSRQIFTDKVISTCHNILDAIEQLLASPTGGTQLDKIGMLRHLQVPGSIISILRNVPSPPRNDVMFAFVRQAVGFLRITSQDDGVADHVIDAAADVRHLLTADVDLLELYRVVYLDRSHNATRLQLGCINEIVSCLAFPHSAINAVLFLQDLARTKDQFNRYISALQDSVWRSLCSTYAAHNVIRVKLRWTGRAGRQMRGQLLKSAEYFNDMGFLRLHLEALKLVFYITKFNKLTRSEEVRHELFGSTSVEDITEVVGNATLPPMYRLPFINLLQTLVVQDHSTLLSFLTNRSFIQFLRRSHEDIRRLRIVLGDKVQPLGEAPLVAIAENHHEAEMEHARNSPDVYVQLVLLGIMPCLKYICGSIEQLQNARISDQALTDIMDALNVVIDESCELVRFTSVLNHFADFPPYAACHTGRMKLYKMLRAAIKNGICGTELWSASIEQAAEAALPTDPDPTGPPPTHSPPGEELKLTKEAQLDMSETQRWVHYYTTHVTRCPALAPDNEFASAAGVVLRSGALGTRFLRYASASLLELPDSVVPSLLKITGQVVSLPEGTSFDDSELLDGDKSPLQLAVEALPGEMAFSFKSTTEDRQNVIASWAYSVGRKAALMPAITSIISTSRNSELVFTALRAGIQLTDGGNRNIQRTLNDALRQRPDEELFVYLRGQFATFRDALRIYLRLSAAGNGAELDGTELVTLLLRLVQLLCEGHFEEFQDYMRGQDDNQVSVNVLESLVALIDAMIVKVELKTYPVLLQLLATIAELIQGPCRGNQEAFISQGIGDALAALISLPREEAPELSPEQLGELHEASVIVLLSLLEGRSDAPQLSSLISSMSLTLLIEAMDRSYDDFAEAHGGSAFADMLTTVDPKKELKDELRVGIQVFIFFKNCLDIQHIAAATSEFEFEDREGLTLKQALRASQSYKFFNKRVAMIEIARGNSLERVYFRVPTISEVNLRDESKEQLIKRVNRENDTSRLLDFFERCAKLILELEYYEHMRRLPLLNAVHEYSAYLDVFSLLIAVVINLILIFTIVAPDDLYSESQTDDAKLATRIFGIAQMALQGVLFFHFFMGPMQVHLDAKWLRWQDAENEDAAQASREDLSIDPARDQLHAHQGSADARVCCEVPRVPHVVRTVLAAASCVGGRIRWILPQSHLVLDPTVAGRADEPSAVQCCARSDAERYPSAADIRAAADRHIHLQHHRVLQLRAVLLR